MITIYTDGSCLTNPGNGGWAAIINDWKEVKKISGNEKNTTNNRMELLAPINALKDMKVIKLQEEKDTGSCEISAAENFLNLV